MLFDLNSLCNILWFTVEHCAELGALSHSLSGFQREESNKSESERERKKDRKRKGHRQHAMEVARELGVKVINKG